MAFPILKTFICSSPVVSALSLRMSAVLSAYYVHRFNQPFPTQREKTVDGFSNSLPVVSEFFEPDGRTGTCHFFCLQDSRFQRAVLHVHWLARKEDLDIVWDPMEPIQCFQDFLFLLNRLFPSSHQDEGRFVLIMSFGCHSESYCLNLCTCEGWIGYPYSSMKNQVLAVSLFFIFQNFCLVWTHF